MKKKFSLLILKIFVLLIILTPKSFSNELGLDSCETLRQELLKNRKLYFLSYYPTPEDVFFDVGFDLQTEWNEATQDYEVLRSKDNYLIVGRILKQSTVGKVSVGDEMIEVNGLKTNSGKYKENTIPFYRNMFDDYTNKKETKIVLRNKKGEMYNFNEIPTRYQQVEAIIELNIKSITDINEKKSEFSAFVSRGLKFRYQPGDGFQKATLKNLLTPDGIVDCNFSEKEWNEVKNQDPDKNVTYYNVIDFDKTKIEKTYKPIILEDDDGKASQKSKVELRALETGIYKFSNNFNLMAFPFDKQVLRITSYDFDNAIDSSVIMPGEYNLKYLQDFQKSGNISPGWKIKKIEIIDDVIIDPTINVAGSALHVDIHVEREVGYYLFKIIFPIVLILMVCWSVSWINPRELESRLTITVVCLLSLIAYNFVIDSELPKLNYLTVLDMIILTSYIFATIPNFLSIAVFRLQKTNPSLCQVVEEKSKRYGALSYILIILFIILININLSPNHTGALFSWAVL